ncbi:AAA family ATPase [Pseudomaricurvus sp.]|uniref:AAA family ATPase n=1 Tax=Pseudomaricurvus sp. TaxID=2004510 RepID=UPI003F6B0902
MQVTVSEDIACLLKQRVPLIALESSQEKYALELLQRQCQQQGQTLYRWTLTEGLDTLGFGPRLQKEDSEQTPVQALQAIKARNDSGVFVLCDFHSHMEGEAKVIRLLKDIALNFDVLPKRIVFLSHRIELPPELLPFASRAQLSLPSDDEILNIIRQEAKRYAKQSGQQRIRTDAAALKLLVASLRGMTHQDVTRLAYHAIADDGAISDSDLPEVNSAKFAILNQQGLLSYEYDTESFADVGGLDNFKGWLQQRQKVFSGLTSPEDESPLDPPKGVLLLGVQGGGKSLAAKAVAGLWQLPLLRLDMGSLYNKFIGESEKNLREALQQADQMAPCVLWLDELEKAMAQGGADDGLGRRLLGYFLTWMAERKKPVFLVATSNDIQKLPAELVRKGRFDEIFFVDLPSEEVREIIFDIHLKKRGIAAEGFDLGRVAAVAEGFSGAEIEQAVVSALYSLDDDQRLTENDLIKAIVSTTPLSVVMAEQITALRHWAEGRAVSA